MIAKRMHSAGYDTRREHEEQLRRRIYQKVIFLENAHDHRVSTC